VGRGEAVNNMRRPMKTNVPSEKYRCARHKYRIAMRCTPCVLLLALLFTGITRTSAATVDLEIINHPEAVPLDRSSTGRWQALFNTKPAWVTRQIAFLETRQTSLRLSLLLSRGPDATNRSPPGVGNKTPLKFVR
jgi:hypothetical protein